MASAHPPNGPSVPSTVQRFTDSPLVKWVMNVLQGVAVAAILAVGTSAINKLDSIITSINAFNTEMALVKRDVRVIDGAQTVMRNEVDTLKQTTFRLELKVDQLEQENQRRKEKEHDRR